MTQRKTSPVTVLQADQHHIGFPPSDLVEFVQWANDTLKQVPLEYRDTARIYFEWVCGYDDDKIIEVQVSYLRPETDEEMAAREKLHAEHMEMLREHELATLRKLLAKYGGGHGGAT